MITMAIYVENIFLECQRVDAVPRVGEAVVIRHNAGLRVADVKWVLDMNPLSYVELHLVNVRWERGPR